jgi:alkyl hydroperoxide reductase subunit AhpF
MSVTTVSDNLSAVVHHALQTTRATTICPFHLNVTIRVGDDAAESHAWARAKKVIRSDGTHWGDADLKGEFERQLGEAADRYCPQCTCLVDDPSI